MYTHLHARPAIPLDAPKLIMHFVYMLDNKQNKFLMNLIDSLLPYFTIKNIQRPYNNNTFKEFIEQQKGEVHDQKGTTILIQKHTEFITFTVISYLDETNLSHWLIDTLPNTNFAEQKPTVAIYMRVETYDASKNVCHNLKDLFSDDDFHVDDVYGDLLGSRVSNGQALVWTPFGKYKSGYNRVVIRNINLNAARLGRLVRRILEIETYMFITLLNYEDAQNQISEIKNRQQELTQYIEDGQKRKLSIINGYGYKKVEEMALDISKKISSSQFKFNASVAYAELVWQGIKELKETRIEGWSRIGYFLERNFRPAVRTCVSAISCQNAFSENIKQAAQLLESKVDLWITRFLVFLTMIATIYYTSQFLFHCFNLYCFGLK